jgi:hypothetical protein
MADADAFRSRAQQAAQASALLRVSPIISKTLHETKVQRNNGLTLLSLLSSKSKGRRPLCGATQWYCCWSGLRR